jgi:hypothetical protein
MKTAGALTIVYGLVTAGAGLWRHFETGSNPQALWFGVVMGASISGTVTVITLDAAGARGYDPAPWRAWPGRWFPATRTT